MEDLENRTLLSLDTITSLTVSRPAIVYGQTETLTARVSAVAQDVGIPTGTVQFQVDGVNYASPVNLVDGVASLDTVSLNAGYHTFQASYTCDSLEFAPSQNLTSTIRTVTGEGTTSVQGVATDSQGNLFYIDYDSHRVLEINVSTGQTSTVAGNGLSEFSGDGGPATDAGLYSPTGIAVDLDGNVFITDYSNNRVREVIKATGQIMTVAGTGVAGFSGDGKAATDAELHAPYAVAVDTEGNLFIADVGNYRIREVIKGTGQIITVAGNGIGGFFGDGKAATAAQLSNPRGITLDGVGNLFIADTGNNRIREVIKATGQINTVAGNGSFEFSGDGDAATAAGLSKPLSMAIDTKGNLFIADTGNGRIRKVVMSTGLISTIIGDGTSVSGGDGGPLSDATISRVYSIAIDHSGSLYIGEFDGDRVRQVIFDESVTVSAAGTATVVSASAPSTTFGQTVVFTASVSVFSPSMAVAQGAVQFVVDGTNFGGPISFTQGMASLALSSLPVGVHTVATRFVDPAGNFLPSDTNTQTLNVNLPDGQGSLSSYYRVTTLDDSGPGSLRDGLASDVAGTARLISFDPGLSGTIELLSPLVIRNVMVSISGPGKRSLIIRDTTGAGIFDIQGSGVLSSLSNLTLIDRQTGNTMAAGAIVAEPTASPLLSILNLSNVVFQTVGPPADKAVPHVSLQISAGSAYASVIISHAAFLGNADPGLTLDTKAVQVAGATLLVTSTTFAGFSTALELDAGVPSAEVRNSTIVNGVGNGGGAAIQAVPTVPLSIIACTIANNRATGPGFVISAGSTANPALIQSSILYANSTNIGSALQGVFVSGGYNDLQTDPNGSNFVQWSSDPQTSDLSVDPLLTDLGNFGGSTPTLALLPGSPVLHRGLPGLVETDQRGYTRVASAPAIGAFEGTGVLFTVTSTDDNAGIDPAPDSTFLNLTGTLRQAFVDAAYFNAHKTDVTAIAFAIPGSSGTTPTIQLDAPLPTLVGQVVIDGTTQSRVTGTPVVRLEGGGLVPVAMTVGGIFAHQSQIQGLDFDGFTSASILVSASRNLWIGGNAIEPGSAGIQLVNTTDVTIGGTLTDDRNRLPAITLDAGSSQNLIEGNDLGIAANGLALSAGIPAVYGINVQGNLNTIGGTDAGAANRFGGFTGAAIWVSGQKNQIIGNVMGVGLDLATPLPNQRGILVTGSSNVLTGNHIVNSVAAGIEVQGTPIGNVIQSNDIMANGGPGLWLGAQAARSTTVRDNQFAGNAGLAIAVDFSAESGYPAQNYQTTPAKNVPGSALNAPVLTATVLDSGYLSVTGYARPGSVLQFYAARPDTTGFGQGSIVLGTYTVGSASDQFAGQPTQDYNHPSAGSDTDSSIFRFSFAVPATISPGTAITALSLGTPTQPAISEFGLNSAARFSNETAGPVLYARASDTLRAGQTYSYLGSFTDRYSTHVSGTVDYGDGSGLQPLTLTTTNVQQPTSDNAFPTINGTYQLSHLYASAGAYTTTITLTDDAGLSRSSTIALTVTSASNPVVSPISLDNTSSLAIAVDNATLTEGDSVSLSGNLVAAVPADSQSLTIDWGDGSQSVVSVDPGVSRFSGVTHTYAANSASLPGGAYTILATLRDTDQPTIAAVSASVRVVVAAPPVIWYPAPEVMGLQVADQVGTPITQTGENTKVVLTGTFSDLSNIASQTSVTIDWGDGSTSAARIDRLTQSFTASHLYGANPDKLLTQVRTITATATNPQWGAGSATATLDVVHIAPVLTMQSQISNGSTTLTAPTVAGDTTGLTYQWSVNGTPVAATDGQVPLPGVPGQDVIYTVSVQAKDSYGSSSSLFTSQVILLDTATAIYEVQEPTGPGGASGTPNLILVNDLQGGKTVVGGQAERNTDGSLVLVNGMPVVTNPVTTPIVFDGSGGSTFVGGAGSDVFNLHSNGDVAYATSNNNSFVMQPNCTLKVVTTGQNNTLDFSRSNYGLDFDMSKSDGTIQSVNPAAPGVDLVSVDTVGGLGSFTKVIGSNYNDHIQAVSGSTIMGGGGTDQVALNSVQNVTVYASTGGNQITASGSRLGNFTFQSDAGASNADVIFNNYTQIDGTVNFNGDRGTTTFNNTAGTTSQAKIIFTGDTGSTIFNNTTGATNSATINFGGDRSTTTFNNAPGSSNTGTIVFGGDRGAATFNNGVTTSTTINVTGDLGSTGLVNGSNSGTIEFVGDGGSAVFNNAPGASHAGTIIFSGDLFSATFNNGSADPTTAIDLVGDRASTTLTNTSTTTTGKVIFTGDGGRATFNNNPGVAQGGEISFIGDRTTNTYNNQTSSTTTGTVIFTGDQSTQTFINSATATQTGKIIFSGDGSTATYTNSSTTSSGKVIFTGDHGAATYENDPQAIESGSVEFSGDRTSNTLNNQGTVGTGGTVIFGGDRSSSTLNNSGTVSAGSTITFGGDRGSSTYTSTSGSTTTGTVIFTGDQSSKTYVNSAGAATTGKVVFTGDSGSSTYSNASTVSTGKVIFTGDDSYDTFENALHAVQAGTITFSGDRCSSTFTNRGTVGSGGTVVFGGDTQTLAAGLVDRIGDRSSNTFNNLGTVGSTGQIIFGGDRGSNTLNNTATGSQTGTVVFTGDKNSNTLKNASTTSTGTVIFTGDGANGNSELVWNQGALNSDLSFTGGSQAVSSMLVNTGSVTGNITFAPGSGVAAFYNGAVLDGTLVPGTIQGRVTVVDATGTASFVNDGSVSGVIAFTSTASTGSAGETLFNHASGTIQGSIGFTGDTAADLLYNWGSIAPIAGSSVVSVSDTGSPLVVYNALQGTISGALIADSGSSLFVENAGSLANTSVDAGRSSGGQLLNDRGGSLSAVRYVSSAAGDRVASYGVVSGFTLVGGSGPGELDLYGPSNQAIVYQGGSQGDTLVVGTNAGNVSGIRFQGGAGPDLFASNATNIADVEFVAGQGPATLLSLGQGASGVRLIGGPAQAILINSGDQAADLYLQAGTGGATLENAGAGFGTLTLVGGAGSNQLINSGAGTASSKILFTGGSGDNSLVNSGDGVGLIAFQDGVGLSSTDTLTNGGSYVALITMATNASGSLLENSGLAIGSVQDTAVGGYPTLINTGSIISLTFSPGAGNGTLIDQGDSGPGSSLVYQGGSGLNTFIDGATIDVASFDAGAGSSVVLVQTGASGQLILTAGAGSNTYQFNGTPQAAVVLKTAIGAGSTTDATLDFSTYLSGGIALDLMKTELQSLPGGLSITLTDPQEISQVIGTTFSDTIAGNLRTATIQGTALPNPFAGVASSSLVLNPAKTQWVLLDFTSFTDTIGTRPYHNYTQAERASILDAMEADYIGPDPAHPWFNVRFALDISEIPPAFAGAGRHATLYFNKTPSTGQPGGESSEIDFANQDLGGSAAIQITGMLGGVDQPADTTTNFDLLSAKVGAHELAHLMGVRHSDAFGPIDYGIHTPPGSTAFNPSVPAPNAAFETLDHLISSPASQGSDRFNDLRPLYFGAREAVKLAFADQGTVTAEQADPHATTTTAMNFPLVPLAVPNTDLSLSGIQKGMNLQATAGAVAGTIGLDPVTGLAAPDYYAFTGKMGDVFTFETISQILPAGAGGGSVDTVLSVYDRAGNLVPYYGRSATNDDQFEGTDSLLDDVILPADGTYYVRVSSFAAQAGDVRYNPTSPLSPLYPGNTQSTLNPANPNYDPAARAAYIATGQGKATGRYDLFIYRISQADPNAATAGDTLVARAASTVLAGLSPNNHYVGVPGTSGYQLGSNQISMTASSSEPQVEFLTTQLFNAWIQDSAGTNSFPIAVDFGDGTTDSLVATPGQPLAVSHLYAMPGQYTVALSYTVGLGSVRMNVPVSINETQVPQTTITNLPATVTPDTPASFTAAIQNPSPGADYTAIWTFTDQTTLQQAQFQQTIDNASSALPFTLTQSFPVGRYTVSLLVTNTRNQKTGTAIFQGPLSFVAGTYSVVISQPIADHVYTGQPYEPPTSSIAVTDSNSNSVSNPPLDLQYFQTSASGAVALTSAPVNPGNYLLVALYQGGSSSEMAQSQPVPFTIVPATPILTLSGQASQTYNGLLYPAITVSAIGVDGGQLDATGVVFHYSQATASGLVPLSGLPTNVGSYQLIVTYPATLQYQQVDSLPFVFAITPAHLTVTADPQSKTYNGQGFTGFTATITGWVNNETLSVVTGTVAFGGAAVSAVNAGTYAIIPNIGSLAAANYDFTTFNAGTLTIVPVSSSTGLSSTQAGANFGTRVAFTATVTTGATGLVQFFDSPNATAAPGTPLGAPVSLSGTIATLETSSLAGGLHYITAVYTGNGNYLSSSSSVLTFVVNQAPMVSTQPVGSQLNSGAQATFSATAVAYPVPSVQWQISINGGTSWANIAGATQTSYTTTVTLANDASQYRAVFSNSLGSAASAAALLRINQAPRVTSAPADVWATVGTTATFTAAATGVPTATVYWEKNTGSGWTRIDNAASTTYTTPVLALADTGTQYRVVFTNAFGSVTSNPARLTIKTVANVSKTTVAWGANGAADLFETGDGRLLPRYRTTDIPWLGIDRITLKLDQAISSLSANDITLRSAGGFTYRVSRVTGSGDTWMITLASGGLVNADRVTVTFSSSNLARYSQRLDVLPGDVNDDGQVNSLDMLLVSRQISTGPYIAFFDVDGDGSVATTDVSLVKARLGKKLPG